MAKETLSFIKSNYQGVIVNPASLIRTFGVGPASEIANKLSSSNGKEVDWNTQAKPMIEEHLGSANPITTYNKSGNRVPLKGLRVDKALLEPFTLNANIKEVFLMPAVRTEAGKKVLTTVLVGIDQMKNVDTTYAIEFCSPCPEDCPENMKGEDIPTNSQ